MQRVSIVKATSSDKSVIANLVQLYLYDMTEYYSDWPIKKDGRFQYDMLENFWQHPYLIYENQDLVGFALVIDNCPITQTAQCWFMAEIFVLKNCRGKGIGAMAVQQITAKHNGQWHIAAIDKHDKAVDFWQKTLQTAQVTKTDFDDAQWTVFDFQSL